MTRYIPEINGPQTLKVYIEINNVECEVEATVSKQACGTPFEDKELKSYGWQDVIEPEFLFEGYDYDGHLMIFTEVQLRLLESNATKQYWEVVRD